MPWRRQSGLGAVSHYDVGNDFYRLFLDKNMVYTSTYFTDWNNSLEPAQLNKLDMVCREAATQAG